MIARAFTARIDTGVVEAFDEAAGLGTLVATDGTRAPFQCIEIADGTRAIDPGTRVAFRWLPKLGGYEAAAIVRR